jgi:hypothetical protein
MARKHGGTTGAERRGGSRAPTSAAITVHIDRPIVGPGQNLSSDGLFFVTDGAIRVRVSIEGESDREGELIRLQSLGGGKLGLAVRFV